MYSDVRIESIEWQNLKKKTLSYVIVVKTIKNEDKLLNFEFYFILLQ